MTYEFEYVFQIAIASALGRDIDTPKEPINWEKALSIAQEQTALTNILHAIKKNPSLVADNSVQKKMINRFDNTVLIEKVKRFLLYSILKQFELNSIPYAILKGIGLSIYYNYPESRVAGDVDIYVGVENEDRAIAILMENGVSVSKRSDVSHESYCWHPQIGLIELHAFLFNEEDRKYWFALDKDYTGITEPFKKINIDMNHTVTVLGDQDNAMFLSLHFVKHFIREGVGIRNIIDICLFFKENSSFINFDLLWDNLHKLGYDNIIRVVLSCGVYYSILDKDNTYFFTPLDPKIVNMFLDDVEQGGYLGINDVDNRKNLRMVYEKYMYEKKGLKSDFIKIKKKRIIETVRLVFSCKPILLHRYKYVNKYRFLMPVAWTDYCVRGIIKVLIKECSSYVIRKNMVRTKSLRLELFRKLNVYN